MKRLARALSLATALALVASGASAQGRTLEFLNFHADLVVHADGSLEVTESIRIRFIGSWNGLLREIPVEYDGEHGTNYTLVLRMQTVTDSAGTPLEWESERRGGRRLFRVWVPDARNATHTVLLRYRVANAIRFFEQHDELYWNVTGNDSEFRVENASARITLPVGATGIRATAYTGPAGATGRDATVTVTGDGAEYRTTQPLEYREGLTVVAGWDPGVVARPTTWDRIVRTVRSNVPLLAPVLAFLGMFLLWRRYGRDPERRPIVPRYEPPAGLTPAEAGTLIDASPDMRDITATLVDLAVRGFIRIEETKEDKLFGLSSTRVFSFSRLRPADAWSALEAHERALLEALFDDGAREHVATKDLENAFYADLPGIRSQLDSTLVREKHYLHHPDKVRALFIALAIVLGLVVGFGGAAWMAYFGQRPGIAIAAGLLTAAVFFGFGLVMPARTVRGTRTLEEILGFEEFLRRVEKDRFERVVKTPELFERYLPYAMAFGIEQSWARAFEDIYREPPRWYAGPAGSTFHAGTFTADLGRMATVTSAAMTAAPRSSSSSSGFSSGGGGGGFSGGGFGGGSVGGF